MTTQRKTKGRPDAVDIYAGKRLRARRNRLGLSQQAVATTLGITFQQLQKYERGLNRMSTSTLFRLARTLDVSLDYFVEGYQIGDTQTNANESLNPR
jgi:transcriptional regulator with XRE-family HTH domain